MANIQHSPTTCGPTVREVILWEELAWCRIDPQGVTKERGCDDLVKAFQISKSEMR